ncbi:MAG: FAD-dependent oxidoreductase [Proteobacteria bacterium]|nr:FAD-dependent oxidoreductase [Pseudomonadota bacterium]HQR03071.1 FAD-dependent oxidoreductase [Rhodocyclaceae bacterium]
MSKPLSSLLAPGRIGSLELRNRIFMTPMGSNLAEKDGYLNDRIKAYYEARARGGAALLIMGSVSISWPIGSANANQVAISDDRFIPGFQDLANRIHGHGCRIAVQLQHAGVVALNDTAAGRPLLVPSVPKESTSDMGPLLTQEEIAMMAVPFTTPTAKVHYQVATEEDLAWVISQFADAAERAKRAGLDAVEIHAGHGYLISAFLSPSSNRRTDRWGGSLENRARLLVEVVRAVRERVGKDFTVWCRIDGVEFLKLEGITSADACAAAQMAEAAGVDALNVSAYADPDRSVGYSEAHATHIPGKFVPYAAAIKKSVNIPVITAGRLEPEVADELIRRGEIDFITMGRKLLADPDLPNKLKQGKAHQIRPCIYCYTCISRIFVGEHVRCAVNVTTAHEIDRALTPASKRKRILVVGGGPAGMEAARVAAVRGHDVTLYEQAPVLGGTLRFSAIVYPPNGKLITYLENAIREAGVHIRLGTGVDSALARQLAPDAIVVATGARRGAPPVPGADLPHVLTGDSMRAMMGAGTGASPQSFGPVVRAAMAMARMSGITRSPDMVRSAGKYWLPFGKRVVIYGGGLVGIEMAEYLAEHGREVVVLEEGAVFAPELQLVRRARALHECDHLGVARIPNVSEVSILPAGVRYRTQGGQLRTLNADHVILAAGAEGDMTLANRLQGDGFAIHAVGDCSGLGYIEGAMNEGHAVGRSL